ncbi:MAG: response regulator [Actinobacteria bacterium]|nr:response regulator [Actinomycetota bacterium]
MQLLIAHKDARARAALAKATANGEVGDLEVIESGEGTEALELLLQDDAPRLAVVDWDLPGLDGPELCRLVRDFHLGGPPYIVLLAAGSHPDIEAGLEAGANDCIRTPAGAAEIRARVDAGRRFVQVPWERAGRGASLATMLSSQKDEEAPGFSATGGATLDAVRSADTDDDAWDALESEGAKAGTPGRSRRDAQLLALLG